MRINMKLKYKINNCYISIYLFTGFIFYIFALNNSSEKSNLLITIEYLYFMVGVMFLLLILRSQRNNEQNEDKTQKLLLASDKLAIAGQLAAGIAHEVRNPLTSLKGFLQLMQSGRSNKEEYYDIMASELNRIELILSELLMLAKPQLHESSLIDQDLLDLIKQVIVLLNTQAIMNNIQLNTEFKVDILYVKCNENQIKQVFINLIKNAIDAMPNGGEILIKADKTENLANILFIDRGYGIAEDKLEKIGEAFYSTKEGGTGLGLMLSLKIIEDHGGVIIINSKIGVGTTIKVNLPLSH